MRLLVTGASGFIGKNFLLSVPKGYEATAAYRSENFLSFLKEHGLENVDPVRCDLQKDASPLKGDYTAVLHLAGNTNPQLSFNQPSLDLRANAVAFTNLLEKVACRRLVFFSSGAVYDGHIGPVSPKTPVSPRLPYAISKLAGERYAEYAKEKGIADEYVIIRFFGAYGPFEPERKIYSKLLKVFLFEKRSSYTVYGNGKNLIDAMWVGDAVRAIHLILSSRKANYTADLATRAPISIDELVRRVALFAGVTKPIIRHEGVTHEPIRFHSVDTLLESMGFRPKVSLEDGLRQFAEFMINRLRR